MNSRGNAFIYILIAVVLFGALTFALSSSQEEAPISELGEGRAKIAANAILAAATATQNAIVNLDRLGTSATLIDFTRPGDAGFNTPPHINKLYHPEGGGLAYKPLPVDAIDKANLSDSAPPGIYVGRFNNYEWTPSTAQDVVFTAWGITLAVCTEINKTLGGTTSIPPAGTRTQMRRVMVDDAYHPSTNADVTAADCPSCDGYPAACVHSSGTPTLYAFYSLMVSR